MNKIVLALLLSSCSSLLLLVPATDGFAQNGCSLFSRRCVSRLQQTCPSGTSATFESCGFHYMAAGLHPSRLGERFLHIDEDGPGHMVGSVDNSNTYELIYRGDASITNNHDGTFFYDPNGAYEHLLDGQMAPDTFSYKATNKVTNNVSTEVVSVIIVGADEVVTATEASTTHETFVQIPVGGLELSDVVQTFTVSFGHGFDKIESARVVLEPEGGVWKARTGWYSPEIGGGSNNTDEDLFTNPSLNLMHSRILPDCMDDGSFSFRIFGNGTTMRVSSIKFVVTGKPKSLE